MQSSNTMKLVLGLLSLLTVVFSVSTLAKEVTVKQNPEITLQPKSLSHRVCLYGGKDYSLGAVLILDKVILECKAENDFESNGRLKWHKVDKKG